MDLKFALQRPFTDIKKLLIGILLSVIPLVNLFSFGYQIECARLTLKKKKNLPEWKNWKELFINGLLYFIIVLIYFIPVIFVSILWMGKELLKGILSPSFNADLLTENEIIKLSSVLILVFFILYWVYGALINYSSNFLTQTTNVLSFQRVYVPYARKRFSVILNSRKISYCKVIAKGRKSA